MKRKPETHWLEAIVGSAWLLALFLALLLASSAALAQFSCEPKTVGNQSAVGSRIVSKKTTIGEWRYIWCPDPVAGVFADGKPAAWRIERHVCLTKYCAGSDSLAAMVWSAMSAPDRLSAINSAITLGTIKPQTPEEIYQFRVLWREACLDAYTPPYLVDIAPGAGPFCGPPIPLPVVAAVWLVAPNGISSTRPMWAPPDGLKSVTERATVGAACNESATPVIKNTQTLLPVKGGSVNLTACAKQ